VSKVGERGEDLLSPDLQNHSMDSYAARHNIEIVEHIVDLDESGRDFEKRKVKAMIDGISSGEADMVLLWKWSRWGRNLLQSRIYIAAVESAGGQVRAAEEDFDPNTTMGKFTRDQMLMIAELVSNQISDGWKETHAKRRRDGLPHTAAPRFGYVYTRGTGYAVDPQLKPVLVDVYRRFAAGESMKSLTDWLNSSGILTGKGNRWAPTSLGRMLDTGFAAGLIRERTNPPKARNNKQTIKQFDIWRRGAHEPMIPIELWERYKARRLHNAAKPRRLIGATHTLSGMLVCGLCGSGMHAVYSGKHNKHTWTCTKRKRLKEKGLPVHEPVTGSNRKILAEIETWLLERQKGGSDVELRAQREKAARTTASNVTNLEAELKRLKDKRYRLSSSWTDQMIEREDYDRQREEIKTDLVRVDAALTAARAESYAAEVPSGAIFESLSSVWADATPEERRMVLTPLVRAVVVFPGPWTEGKVFVVPTWW
jgi:DNA invertase Pin-like site-specific DNA recombinase